MAAALPVADHLDAHEQVRRKRAAEVVQRERDPHNPREPMVGDPLSHHAASLLGHG